MRALISISGDTSERRGLLGGRYKRLYAAAQDPVEKSQYLDFAIKEYAAGMQLDLNDYYPSSNLARLYRLRARRGDEDRARVAAAVTSVACERARAKGTNDPWLKPTLLGAAFDAGDVSKAGELADQVRDDGPVAWQLQATLSDLRRAITFHTGDTAAQLTEILSDLEKIA